MALNCIDSSHVGSSVPALTAVFCDISSTETSRYGSALPENLKA